MAKRGSIPCGAPSKETTEEPAFRDIDEAVSLLYRDLHRLAAGYLRQERPGHTLQPTALINEVYLRLRRHEGHSFRNRGHFIGRVAHMMRQLLVDYARRKNADKRGGGLERVTLSRAEASTDEGLEIIALNDALSGLSKKDPKLAQLVELRYFVGLTLDEVAEVLGISRPSAVIAWRRARIWLHEELDGSGP